MPICQSTTEIKRNDENNNQKPFPNYSSSLLKAPVDGLQSQLLARILAIFWPLKHAAVFTGFFDRHLRLKASLTNHAFGISGCGSQSC